MKKYSKLFLFAFILFLVVFFGLSIGRNLANQGGNQQQTERNIYNFDPRAIVVLGYLDWRQNVSGSIRWPRVAFAIGDGTLLLTAEHCVADFQITPDEPVSSDIVVISPYYGDVYDFEIVAVDKEADLAILKAPWLGHPALEIASEEEFEAAEKILIASRPQENADMTFRPGREIRTELLPVLENNGKNPATALQLKGTKYVAPGWSGSPMLIPETGKVTGVLGQLNIGIKSKLLGLITLSTRNDAYGCNIHPILELLNKHNMAKVALAQPSEFEDIPDAEDSFNLAIDYFETLLNRRGSESLGIAAELLENRPDSVQAHLLLAISSTMKAMDPNSPEIEFLNQAESSYQKALQLDPNNSHVHAVYGNFLIRTGRNDEALENCNASLAIDPNNRMALFNKLRLIDSAEKKDTVERLLSIEPNNPLVWFYYSSALLNLGENKEALEAAQKAVNLDPNGLYYGGLANALMKLDRNDEAESYYKLMTEKCGCQQCWYKYADFLVRNREDKLDEAKKALENAESLSRTRKVSSVNINLLKLELYRKTVPEQGEVLARQLLEDSPENGHYFYAFAGILRTLEKFEEAVKAAQKAVDLCPERSYRPRLANCLARVGELEKAEQIYNEITMEYPERNKYWFWYAGFLVDYFPDRIEEAREALEKASANPDKDWFVPADELEELQEKIDTEPILH